MINIPDVVRNHAVAVGAEQWLVDLPKLVDELEQRWDIAVGRPLMGATGAYVAEATTRAGQSTVLKLLIPLSGDMGRHEITALRLAGGHGCVTLLRDDPDLGALLLERLGPSLFKLDVPIARRHEILCDTAAKLWRPAPGCGLPTGGERARSLATFIADAWETLDHPCTEQAIDCALACARRRETAHDDERAVLVHGDVHILNTLQGGSEFKLIDPDGVLAEPELDLGTIMRGDPVELLQGDPHDWARWLSTRTGLNATAIWEWGVIERVTSGLHCTRIDLQPLGRQSLMAADATASDKIA